MNALADHGTAEPADDSATKFPCMPYADAGAYFTAYAKRVTEAASSIEPGSLSRAAMILLEAYVAGQTVFCCGNGGSAAIANHLQCDHLKGIRTATDLAPRVVSVSSSVELLTAIANDIAYDEVFAYQLQSQATPGDVLIAISSSGRSPSIVRALAFAAGHGLRTIALTGFDGGDARALAEVSLHVNAANYGIVEDVHQSVMHALAQYIRQSRMTSGAVRRYVF